MKICLLGAGNVATHLAKRLGKAVVQVYAPTLEHARSVAAEIPGCEATDKLGKIIPDADLYLIAVKDDAIEPLAAALPAFPGVWAHTSGSVDLGVLERAGKQQRGVVYPMQTFSKNAEVDFSQIPVFVEGSDQTTLAELKRFAACLTEKVYEADSHRRRRLHVAAVFACNFANLMWLEADELLKADGLDIKAMLPLIEATVEKLRVLSPREAMTGPARRGDNAVIAKHLAMLHGSKRDIYGLLSHEIEKQYE